MRTAEEFLMNEFDPQIEDCRTFQEDLRIVLILNPSLEKIVTAINEARKEAIEECAERAATKLEKFGKDVITVIDKQSILSLIDEIK